MRRRSSTAPGAGDWTINIIEERTRDSVTAAAVAELRTSRAVRERCREILEVCELGALEHFELDASRLDLAARYVVETIRQNYPGLNIPYHSRWRHFAAGHVDRTAVLDAKLAGASAAERARAHIDLVVTSVLLDAGAGADWRYTEPDTGGTYARSEGLAVASFHLFVSGALSSRRTARLNADAGGLESLDRETLARAFQVGSDNPLTGLNGRVGLLNALGRVLRDKPEFFGQTLPRVGNLYDYFAENAPDGTIAARDILIAVLRAFAPIWPGRLTLGGENLGDVWCHAAIHRDDPTSGLLPLHKLSQWLSYSLVEPLEASGLRVVDLDELTGLAEYRNGGLFIDLEVLAPRDAGALQEEHAVGSGLVVEWRALTVALLDRLAPLVRALLGKDDESLPLARILEGGTWSAGRRIAAERRSGGEPPVRVVSDGTVF